MRRRKAVRSSDPETLICKKEEEEEKLGAKEGKGFFACYLLTSLSPRHKGQTYIGFTVNPRRRIRQHNGEIMCGAWRTKKKRPWEMVLCVYGFPTNVSALQFEWAWQHPRESLAVRQAAASFKSLSGITNKIKLAYIMLTLPTWQSLNLTVNFFSTKYVKHSSGCPSLPEHMKVQLRSMDELPCYIEGESCLYDNSEDEQECNQGGRANGLLMEDLLNTTANDIEDCDESIELPSLQRYGWIEEENETSQSCESPASKEDHRHPSQLADSPVRKLVLPASSSSAEQTETDQGSIENNRAMWNELPAKTDDKGAVYTEETAEGGDVFGFFCESSFVLGRANRKSPARTDDNKDPPTTSFAASREIEVIDVLTPSPDCRISLCNKKRRVRTVCPEIIDLTKSPLFAQL